MGRILRQIACAAGVMSLVPTSRHLPQQRRAPSRSALQMASQLETLEPQLKRVVITGMGIVSCLGNTLDDVADSLYHARSGIKHMPKYAEIGMKSQVAGRPELDLNDKETIGAIRCANHTSRHFSPDLHAIDATPARRRCGAVL